MTNKSKTGYGVPLVRLGCSAVLRGQRQTPGIQGGGVGMQSAATQRPGHPPTSAASISSSVRGTGRKPGAPRAMYAASKDLVRRRRAKCWLSRFPKVVTT